MACINHTYWYRPVGACVNGGGSIRPMDFPLAAFPAGPGVWLCHSTRLRDCSLPCRAFIAIAAVLMQPADYAVYDVYTWWWVVAAVRARQKLAERGVRWFFRCHPSHRRQEAWAVWKSCRQKRYWRCQSVPRPSGGKWRPVAVTKRDSCGFAGPGRWVRLFGRSFDRFYYNRCYCFYCYQQKG